jgi:hypothetical protein
MNFQYTESDMMSLIRCAAQCNVCTVQQHRIIYWTNASEWSSYTSENLIVLTRCALNVGKLMRLKTNDDKLKMCWYSDTLSAILSNLERRRGSCFIVIC